MLSFVVAYNKVDILEQNLLSSPCIKDKKYQLIAEKGASSASITYNKALEKVQSPYVIFVHQDVYLPSGWDEKLLVQIKSIEEDGHLWGVLGCYGVSNNGTRYGHVYSNGLGRILGSAGTTQKASTIDEMIIILNRNADICFDNKLPGYHFYGTDICFEAKSKLRENFIIKNFCIHNSLPVRKLDKSFWNACEFIRRKWFNELPIVTTCVHIHKSHLIYHFNKSRVNIRHLLTSNKKKYIKRLADPSIVL